VIEGKRLLEAGEFFASGRPTIGSRGRANGASETGGGDGDTHSAVTPLGIAMSRPVPFALRPITSDPSAEAA
jgi:hypothetical protein